MNEVQFSISLLFFWIKGKVSVDNRFIKTNFANTVLGIFPAGKDQQNIPLNNVSGANLNTKYSFKRIIVGLLIAFFGLGSLSSDFFTAIVLIAIGAVIFLSSIETVLTIEKSGTNVHVLVPFFEKAKMDVITAQINDGLTYVADQNDLNRFFDEKQGFQK